MKRIPYILILMLLMSCATAPRTPIPSDRPLYGFTKQGVFFIHKGLVEQAGGYKPLLITEANNYKKVSMREKSDYYYAIIDLLRHREICYCFSIGSNNYIPHQLKRIGSPHFNEGDVKDNKQGGYNFCTSALDSTPF